MENNYQYGEMYYRGILTSYRIYGDSHSSLTPLVVLHGGPSGGFDYLLNYHQLANNGRMVIFYDQLGCGRSTHFPFTNATFWEISIYLQQLEQLLCHSGIENNYCLLGHSWGGMLAAEKACQKPGGLKGVIYASSPASIPLWKEETLRLFKKLNNVSDSYISDVIMHATIYNQPPPSLIDYYVNHVYSLSQEADHIQRSNAQFAADPTGYHFLWGANELAVTGSLAQWDITDSLSNICCPGLVLRGARDQATEVVVKPLLENIRNSRLMTIPDSSHNPHEENPIACLSAVNEFLDEIDNNNRGIYHA